MSDPLTQFTSTTDLLAEETSLRLVEVDELVCNRIGQFIAERSFRDTLAVTTAVFLGDRVVYKAAFPGSTDRNDLVVAAKRRTALLSGHASLYERNRHLEEGTTFEQATGLCLLEYAPFGGAVPLKTESGDLLGMVVVSGMTQEDDHDLAVQAIRAVQVHTPSVVKRPLA